MPLDMNEQSRPSGEARFYPELQSYTAAVVEDIQDLPGERKQILNDLAKYISSELSEAGSSRLLFICTHNSRRSHMSQIWASTAAAYYGVPGIQTYSGGTEVTAFNPRAVAALKRAGFEIISEGEDNPVYKVSYTSDGPELKCFSKKFDDDTNPTEGFTAIMTCSDADRNCPIVPGADARFLVSYEDPKVADNTPEETQRYDERCFQIATEMFYLMSEVNKY